MRIGTEDINFSPESKRDLDIEILSLHIPLLTIIILYGFNLLLWPLFYLLFHMLEMRIFIGNHDRFHTDASRRLPRFIEAFAEHLSICVTPWDETYDSIKWKHIRHHATHRPGKSAKRDTANDPHAVFELGPWWRVLLNCLFYEESQFLLDIRHGNLKRSRLIRVVIYLPIQILFIFFLGWEKFLGVFIAMRLVGAMAWFVFSWGIHQPYAYHFGFSRKVPAILRIIFRIMNGDRVTEGVIHHATHHAWPSVPSRQLQVFDAAVLRNPAAEPDVRPIGN